MHFDFAALLSLGSGAKCLQGASGFSESLGFGFPRDGGVPTLFSSCIGKVNGLRGVTAGSISRSHSKKFPIRTSFGDQVRGKGCPSTGHTY